MNARLLGRGPHCRRQRNQSCLDGANCTSNLFGTRQVPALRQFGSFLILTETSHTHTQKLSRAPATTRQLCALLTCVVLWGMRAQGQYTSGSMFDLSVCLSVCLSVACVSATNPTQPVHCRSNKRRPNSRAASDTSTTPQPSSTRVPYQQRANRRTNEPTQGSTMDGHQRPANAVCSQRTINSTKLQCGRETMIDDRLGSNDRRSPINDQRSTINDQRSTINDRRSTINDQRTKSTPD